MDAHALSVLEFETVRDRLAAAAASSLGVEAARELTPSADAAEVRERLGLTTESRWLLDHALDIPMGGLHDVRPLLRQAVIGSTLGPSDLREIADTIGCASRVRRFFAEPRADGDIDDATPRLRGLAAELVELEDLAAEIERCVTEEGEVADDATPELRRLRRRTRELGDQVQATLRRMVQRLASEDVVQDAVVTLRNGRYCVPVKANFQGRVSGIVHDRSSSGQTVFMEPTEVVRLNNELRETELAERDEVQRILADLTALIAGAGDGLSANLSLLARFDAIRSRGRLSRLLEGSEPILDDSGRFELRRARHPLLIVESPAEQAVVPNDIRLGGEFTTLLVTGPNTGGKTVALKTLGLLTLMAHAGLHVPAAEGSRIAFTTQVFADIGDEQSIAQSLSTFSSHLRHIIRIIDEAEAGALVLLDELGAGTDPTEGAALAQAVLTTLHERGCLTVATTHHGRLKAFAYGTDGVENASVDFDARSLEPTYRLLIGVPGASHAFDIAGRLGLDHGVLDQARALLPGEHRDAADIIVEMQSTQRRMAGELADAEREAAQASHARRELERERRRLRELEQELREEARREAAARLKEVDKEAERILSDLRRSQREGPRTENARQRLRRVREEVNRPLETHAPEPPPAPPGESIGVGDIVEVRRLQRNGTVVDVDDDGELHLQVGPMRMSVPPEDVALVQKGQPRPEHASRGRRATAALGGVEPELKLLGQTVDEALANLDRYLDQAVLGNLPQVRIVHGKGTGALRRSVQEYLRDHPSVRRYEQPPENQGGSGVTIAYFE